MRRGPKPSIWKAEAGRAFFYAVSAVKLERHPIKTVDAIRLVIKRGEFAYLKERYDLRYLERKYQEVPRMGRVTVREVPSAKAHDGDRHEQGELGEQNLQLGEH